MSKDTRLTFGPPMPIVPISDFTRAQLANEQLEDAWRLCGPSAARNMGGRSPLELWKVIAMAYLEGLHHGAALADATSRFVEPASNPQNESGDAEISTPPLG